MKLKVITLSIAMALAAALGFARAAGFGGGASAHGGGFAPGGAVGHAAPPVGMPRAGIGEFHNDRMHEHVGPNGRDGGEARTPHGDVHWHGDARRFADHAMLEQWRGGHWYHGWHGGQLGWWWLVDGDWYYYPSAGCWYYCSHPEGYYPYVDSCSTAWQQAPGGEQPPG